VHRGQLTIPTCPSDGDGDIDENFWAQAAAERAEIAAGAEDDGGM
jgi:hypothetical protein